MFSMLLLLQAHEPLHKAPFDSVPRDLCVWHEGDRRVSVGPTRIANGPFGDRPHGVGIVLTIRITLR